MKERSKKGLIVLLLVAILVVVFLAAVLLKMRSETNRMTPVGTGEIVPGVSAIADAYVNLYLVQTDDGFIAIDAGNDLETVLAGLQTLSIDPSAIKAVLLTHSDYDHTAAIGAFTEAEVFLPEAEIQMIDGRTKRFLFFGNTLDVDYTAISDKQVLHLGGRTIQCIATPGHTPGAMSFLVDNRYLFTGDTMSIKEGKIGPFNEIFNMDTDTQLASLRRLRQLETVTHIFTAHYGYTDQLPEAYSGLDQ